MSSPPTGTVTFLFTDIEGSTKLAQQHPNAMPALLARHHAILNAAIEAHEGYVFQITGDSFCAAFATASDALNAALDAQLGLQREAWNPTPLHVRMGLHTGPAQAGAIEERAGGYTGYLTLTRVQRVMSTAYGGQVLLSNTSAELLLGNLPKGVTLRDVGEHRLKGLLNPERLWQLVAPALEQDFPSLQTLNGIPNNLPIQVTSFIGREAELVELQRLLSTTRLLTLTGSGGTGKTRLSLQVAAEQLDHFKHGIWFVEFAPLADPELVPQTVAHVLDIRVEPGQSVLAMLIDWLRPKQLLLILDNCEHLIDAVAKLADAVLHAGQELQILASSREALGIAGETTYRVPSLACPNAIQAGHETAGQLTQYAAVQLFIERATQSQTMFTVTNANAPAVAQICYRLDGIPLAIELAAARVKLFPPDQIAARLDDRFRLLTGGSRTALPRHQTLRGAIDWSYGLLSESERLLLRRFSVFAGGWFFEAAESVCSEEGLEVVDVLELLSRLVEKSLVVEEDVRGTARYHLLETIRQYARDKLLDSGERARVRARHLAYYSRVAVAFENVPGPEQIAWFERVGSDIDNIRTALDWSLESDDILPGLRMVGALQQEWWQRYPAEGLDRLRSFLSRSEAQERTADRAQALIGAGIIESIVGNWAVARRSLNEALAISKEVDSERLTAVALVYLADAAIGLREYDAASAHLTEALEILRRTGGTYWIGYALVRFGDVALQLGKLEQAQAALEESVTVCRSMGDKVVLPMSLRRLGQIALRRAEYERSVELIHLSLTLNHAVHDVRGLAASMAALAAMRAAQGLMVAAIKVCGAVAAVLDALQTRMQPVDQDEYERTVAVLRRGVALPEFEAAWAEGRALTLEQAISVAERVASEAALWPAAQSQTPKPVHAGSFPAGLTSREVDVLRLLAQGLTDAQIAETLVVSTRTVNAHLRSIYSKLGVTTRTAAARAVAEYKLI